MLTELLYVFGSSMALFLVGANAAFLVNLGRDLATWFVFKVLAVDLVFLYMALSLFYGDPGPWRASLGLVALAVDVVALGWMWLGIERLRKQGVTGLIPIAKLDKSG